MQGTARPDAQLLECWHHDRFDEVVEIHGAVEETSGVVADCLDLFSGYLNIL